MKHRFLGTAVIVLVSLIIALALAEGLLRLIGHKPWGYALLDANEPTVHEPDPALGWRNKQGDYLVPPYHPTGKPIHLIFLDDGRRRTRADSFKIDQTEGALVIVGGSFSQGWAVSDSATYAWKLQQRYPSLDVTNYGTGGYGSYQSLLVLERELPRLASPRLVIYGFIDDHEARNVAPASWLRILSQYSRRGHVDVPFATLDQQGNMVRHPPGRFLSLPLRESFATVALMERAYTETATRGRFEQRRKVTEAILLEMDRVCAEYGAELLIVLLGVVDSKKRHYLDFCTRNDIDCLDSVYPLTRELRVRGEGHPNGRMHSLWANRIATVLDERLTSTTIAGVKAGGPDSIDSDRSATSTATQVRDTKQ